MIILILKFYCVHWSVTWKNMIWDFCNNFSVLYTKVSYKINRKQARLLHQYDDTRNCVNNIPTSEVYLSSLEDIPPDHSQFKWWSTSKCKHAMLLFLVSPQLSVSFTVLLTKHTNGNWLRSFEFWGLLHFTYCDPQRLLFIFFGAHQEKEKFHSKSPLKPVVIY